MDGIVIKFDGWSKNIFEIMFDRIDYTSWEFSINYWESYSSNGVNNSIDSDGFPLNLFKEQLSKQSEIITEFAEIYVCRNKCSSISIETYNDFLESSYFLSIVIIDHRNIEICCKEETLLKHILKNVQRSKLKNLRLRELNHIPLNSKLKAWRSKDESSIYD